MVAAVAVLVLVIGAVWFVRLGWIGGTDGPVITSPRGFFSGGGQAALISGGNFHRGRLHIPNE